MAAGPQFSGQLGEANPVGSTTNGTSQLGSMSIGGAGPWAVPLVLPSLDKTVALPFITHLYTNTLRFKASLGPLLNRPLLKWSLNGGHHPVSLHLPVNDTTANGPARGDIVRLTEQRGDGRITYTGIILDIVLTTDQRGPYITLECDSLITELGETFFDGNYDGYTDIAQMVRDAVRATAHLSYTPKTIPYTGIQAKFNFHLTNCLGVLETCKHIGGIHFWYFVDEYGLVWFQELNLGGKPYYTLEQGTDYTIRKKTNRLDTLKNVIIVSGGIENTASSAILSVVRSKASEVQYGTRAMLPPLFFPAAIHQTELDTIAHNIFYAMNQLRPKIELTLPAFGSRIVLGRHGGPSIRYWEPAVWPMKVTNTGTGTDSTQAAGSYSPNYVVLDVEMDGPNQKIVCGPLPITADDFKYMRDGTIAESVNTLSLYPPISLEKYNVLSSLGKLASR